MTTRSIAYVYCAALLAFGACVGASNGPDPGNGSDGGPPLDAGVPDAPPIIIDGGAPPPDAPTPAATLTATPPSLNFDDVEIGRQGTASIVLTNHGATAVTLNTAAFKIAAPFQLESFDCPASLATGASCTVSVLFAPVHVSNANAILALPSSANTVQVPVHGVGLRRISVQITGTGAVTSTPAGIDCPTSCTGLFSTAVTLTATPGAGAVFSGWSPLCDGQPTCTVPAADASINVAAAFAAAPPPHITVHVAGNAPGFTFIQDTNTGQLVTCATSPCQADVGLGDTVLLLGFTPSTFGGWSGGCVATSTDCGILSVTGDVDATVTYNRDERELTTLFPRADVASLAFASDGALIVADHLGVSKLKLDGTAVWTTAITGGAHDLAVDNAGNVYGASGAGAGTGVFSLSPTGTVRWTKAFALAGSFSQSVESNVQVSPDGTVVAAHITGGAHVLNGSGTDRFTVSNLGLTDGFAVAPDGTVAIGVPSATLDFLRDIKRFSSTGAALATIENLPNDTDVSLAFDATNALCGLTLGGQFQWVSRTLADTTPVFSNGGPDDIQSPDAPGAITVDSDGDLIVARGATQAARASGLHLEVWTSAGTRTFVHDKPASDATFVFVVDGVQLRTLAADRHARNLAVGGNYNQSQPWIQIYTMP
jgi:hypothetical protein